MEQQYVLTSLTSFVLKLLKGRDFKRCWTFQNCVFVCWYYHIWYQIIPWWTSTALIRKISKSKHYSTGKLPNEILPLESTDTTAQKLKFSIKNFFSECDQIRRNLRIWAHLLKKSLMENFIFCAVHAPDLQSHLGMINSDCLSPV